MGKANELRHKSVKTIPAKLPSFLANGLESACIHELSFQITLLVIMLFASQLRKLTPVMFPPGRLRLATSPTSTGSTPFAKTIGIFDVAALAARAGSAPPPAKMTDT